MMKIIRYNPAENGGEPQIFRIPPRQTTYRVDIFVKLAAEVVAQRRPISFPDKMTIQEVHAVAREELAAIAPDGAPVESAYFEVWAECGR